MWIDRQTLELTVRVNQVITKLMKYEITIYIPSFILKVLKCSKTNLQLQFLQLPPYNPIYLQS